MVYNRTKNKMLKQYLFRTALIVALAVTVISCKKDDEEKTVETPKLEISTASLNFESDGGEQTVAISSNGSWTASSIFSWCHVEPASGKENGSIRITADENQSDSSRNATVVLQQGDLQKVINVSQAGAIDTTLSAPTNVSIRQSGPTDITISWSSVPRATEYRVFILDADQNIYRVPSNPTRTSVIVDMSSFSAGYFFALIQAINSTSESPLSEVATCYYNPY
jgi:hypothetical protein